MWASVLMSVLGPVIQQGIKSLVGVVTAKVPAQLKPLVYTGMQLGIQYGGNAALQYLGVNPFDGIDLAVLAGAQTAAAQMLYVTGQRTGVFAP